MDNRRPSYYQRNNKGKVRLLPHTKASTAGHVSWSCSHGRCNNCSKLDCPCKCHSVEK